MEKYKKFTDAGTGINPFVPFIPKYTQSSIVHTALSWLRMLLVSPVLFLIKLILLTCMLVAYTIMSTVFSMVCCLDIISLFLFSFMAAVVSWCRSVPHMKNAKKTNRSIDQSSYRCLLTVIVLVDTVVVHQKTHRALLEHTVHEGCSRALWLLLH